MKSFKKRVIALSLCVLSIISNTTGAFAYERGKVNCNLLNVRVSPNTSCEIVDSMPLGTTFDIIYTENGWYNILMANGKTGFVSADYVKKVTSTGENSNSNVTSEVRQEIVNDAASYLGYPYSYGSSGPNAFDCSGFTSYILKQNGVALPRTSYDQGSFGTYVKKSELLPGDLVFFSNRSDKRINHVGIYIGNDEFIHASTSTRGVVKDSLSSNYYVNHYITGRRVL